MQLWLSCSPDIRNSHWSIQRASWIEKRFLAIMQCIFWSSALLSQLTFHFFAKELGLSVCPLCSITSLSVVESSETSSAGTHLNLPDHHAAHQNQQQGFRDLHWSNNSSMMRALVQQIPDLREVPPIGRAGRRRLRSVYGLLTTVIQICCEGRLSLSLHSFGQDTNFQRHKFLTIQKVIPQALKKKKCKLFHNMKTGKD